MSPFGTCVSTIGKEVAVISFCGVPMGQPFHVIEHSYVDIKALTDMKGE